jgi:PD-(D/E)XK endonuclease
MHNKQKGNIGELTVALELSKRGYPVFKELGDLCKVDIITIINNKCIKIQCKNLQSLNINESIQFTIRKAGPNYRYEYTKEDVDVFACLLPNDKVVYLNWKDIGNSRCFVFRLTPPKNNQLKGTHLFENYLDFDRVLATL